MSRKVQKIASQNAIQINPDQERDSNVGISIYGTWFGNMESIISSEEVQSPVIQLQINEKSNWYFFDRGEISDLIDVGTFKTSGIMY